MDNTPKNTGVLPLELIHFFAHHLPENVLDSGCGTGTNLQTLLDTRWEADGVEDALFEVMKAYRKVS